MRHQKHRYRLSRPTGHRNALLRNLARALIMNDEGRIETTHTKAKALQQFVENLITLGKKGELHHRRLAISRLNHKDAVNRLFAVVAPLFAERQGGYTRVIRTRRRAGDGAEMAFIEFTETVPAVADSLPPKKNREEAPAES